MKVGRCFKVVLSLTLQLLSFVFPGLDDGHLCGRSRGSTGQAAGQADQRGAEEGETADGRLLLEIIKDLAWGGNTLGSNSSFPI